MTIALFETEIEWMYIYNKKILFAVQIDYLKKILK